MNARLRQALSALGVVAVVALTLGAAGSTALSIRDARENVARLTEQRDALRAREGRVAARAGRDVVVSPLIEAKTVTLAGAALQQRLEASVASAKGRLVSTRVEVAPRGDERRVALAAELTIAGADLQALLFDLETGRPYLFVDALEARATEGDESGGAMRVSMTVAGQWSGAK
jgi:general secretion pathway protein M